MGRPLPLWKPSPEEPDTSWIDPLGCSIYRAAMIKFIILVNKLGQTRLARYFDEYEMKERVPMEAEIVRKCLARGDDQCAFLEYRDFKIVYRRYASLFFIFGIDEEENE